MNKVLDSKAKKDILSKIKQLDSLAHTNLIVKEWLMIAFHNLYLPLLSNHFAIY